MSPRSLWNIRSWLGLLRAYCPRMERRPDGAWQLLPGKGDLPLMFSLKAVQAAWREVESPCVAGAAERSLEYKESVS
jgi:hypothetical protein